MSMERISRRGSSPIPAPITRHDNAAATVGSVSGARKVAAIKGDTISSAIIAVARPPARGGRSQQIYNLGNHRAEELTRFIEVLERACGREAIKVHDAMQPGDVEATYADIDALETAVGFRPATSIEDGVGQFIQWYRSYYNR